MRITLALLLLGSVVSLLTGCDVRKAVLAGRQARIEATRVVELESPAAEPVVRPSKSVSQIVLEVSGSVFQIREGDSVGTGFAAFDQGVILTAYHVVGSPQARPTVVGVDGTTYQGVVGGLDEIKDLAVILVPKLKAKPIPFASSTVVGESVIAIGYAAGLSGEPSVTKGIVSGKRVDTDASLTYIQTDAPINPGNSGGPLLNEQGEVVAVSVFVYRGRRMEMEGLGFALSSQDIAQASSSLRDGIVTVAPASSPTVQAVDRSLAGQVRYIANTGGSGVRLRTACSDSSAGTGSWPEGTAVTIEYGQQSCAGWYFVRRSASEASWVRSEYLSLSPPPSPTARPTPIPPATATPAANREWCAVRSAYDDFRSANSAWVSRWNDRVRQGPMSWEEMQSWANQFAPVLDRAYKMPRPVMARGIADRLVAGAEGWMMYLRDGGNVQSLRLGANQAMTEAQDMFNDVERQLGYPRCN